MLTPNGYLIKPCTTEPRTGGSSMLQPEGTRKSMGTPQIRLYLEASCREPRLTNLIALLFFFYLEYLMDGEISQKTECIWMWKFKILIFQVYDSLRRLLHISLAPHPGCWAPGAGVKSFVTFASPGNRFLLFFSQCIYGTTGRTKCHCSHLPRTYLILLHLWRGDASSHLTAHLQL